MSMLNGAKLAIGLRRALRAHIPGIVAEVNAHVDPIFPELVAYPITAPTSAHFQLGITTDLIAHPAEDYPIVASGVYDRETLEDINEGASEVIYPYVIQVMLSKESDQEGLVIESLKWSAVLDIFIERYRRLILDGWRAEQSPAVKVTYTLPLKASRYMEVVTIVGTFLGDE